MLIFTLKLLLYKGQDTDCIKHTLGEKQNKRSEAAEKIWKRRNPAMGRWANVALLVFKG